MGFLPYTYIFSIPLLIKLLYAGGAVGFIIYYEFKLLVEKLLSFYDDIYALICREYNNFWIFVVF